MRWAIAWMIVWSAVTWGGAAAEPTCYPPGGVAGIVVATVIVTCVVGGLGMALIYRYWWTPRQHSSGRPRGDQPGPQPHPKNSTEFAFDNPYFRNNQDSDEIDATDKSKNKLSLNNKNSLRSSKQSDGKARRSKGGKNPFVFGGGKKQKAMDDSCISHMEPERTVVSLRGHDFTGLGFNIMGNMRDGILVKDVLHRGPASESGLIKAGDKIVSVTVSFTNIVYEDALTILSYASPYDVQLEIERLADKSSTPTTSKRLGSCSFSHSGQKLFHPLYRSQSIDDLTQIDREGGPGPRRSQSIGVAAHKLASRAEERERMSLILSTTGSLNEKMLANVMAEGSGGGHWKKRFEDSFESDDNVAAAPKRESSKRYLDGPQARQKLEQGRVEDEASSINSKRDVTEVNTWQPHQVEEVSQVQREDVPVTQNLPSSTSKSRLNLMEEDNNDSDVSKDSLEISARSYQKRKPLRGSPLVSPKNQVMITNTVQIESHPPTVRMERIYANNDRSCKSPSSQEGQSSDRTVYTSRLKVEGVSEVDSSTTQRVDPYRNAPKPSQGERQKLNNSDAFAQNYGCRTQVPNGSMDEHRGSTSNYSRQIESDDSRKADMSVESKQKFSRKTNLNPAGGMFTQISPFQMPSSKQRHFRPWGAREDLSKPSIRQTASEHSGPKFTLRDSSMQHRQF